MAGNSFSASSSAPVVGRLLSAIARNKIQTIVLRYMLKNKKEETRMKVAYRKRYILNHRGRIRISKSPPSRYCGCVTAPVKFRVLCHVFFLMVCLFVFVVSFDEMSFMAVPHQNT